MHMTFAAAVILVVLALYKLKKEKATAPPKKPYLWRDLPLYYYYLFLLIAVFLFICGLHNIYRWGNFVLMEEIVPFVLILFVLTVWNVICNSLKYGKVCYSVLGAILLLQICFLTYLIYENVKETSSENIENFRRGIANCNQALGSGKKEDLKKKIMEFNKSINPMKSFHVFTQDFEKITAPTNNHNDGVQP